MLEKHGTKTERTVALNAVYLHETDSAHLLLIEGRGNQIWLPKSQVQYDHVEEIVYIPEWLAIKRGLV